MILDKKNEIKVAHFPKKHRFSPILFCKDNNKITKKKEIRSETGKKTDERVISGYKKAPASSDTRASSKTATTYSPTVTQYHRRD